MQTSHMQTLGTEEASRRVAKMVVHTGGCEVPSRRQRAFWMLRTVRIRKVEHRLLRREKHGLLAGTPGLEMPCEEL